jgi:SH3 domain protein
MSHRRILYTLAVLLSLLTSAAQAAFITDKIVVEVHAQRFNQGAALKTLPSGSSVEVLMSDGEYSRIRTPDNITGWVESKYLSNEKPMQLEYLELLAKSKGLEARLKAAEERFAQAEAAPSNGISEEELADLKKRAKDAGWMRAEMQKARDRAQTLEKKLQSISSSKEDSRSELEELQAKNADLEQRLAAALLVNEQQETEANTLPVNDESLTPGPTASVTQQQEENGWSVAIEWFFGSIVVSLIVGAIAGMVWLDNRIRQRHGGFRIY